MNRSLKSLSGPGKSSKGLDETKCVESYEGWQQDAEVLTAVGSPVKKQGSLWWLTSSGTIVQ